MSTLKNIYKNLINTYIDDIAFFPSFLQFPPRFCKENVRLSPLQSQVTMRRRSWSLATMETQLEMLGILILYSVALRAENGVRSVTQFFNTFRRALQEINKSELRDLSLRANWTEHSLAGILDLAFVGLAAVSCQQWHGGPSDQEIWCLRCHRVQSQSLVMVIEGDNYVDVYHNSSLGFMKFFFEKGTETDANSPEWKVDLEWPRTNVAIFLSFQRRSLAPLFWCKKWDMKWEMRMVIRAITVITSQMLLYWGPLWRRTSLRP